jgi:hypothetical protein
VRRVRGASSRVRGPPGQVPEMTSRSGPPGRRRGVLPSCFSSLLPRLNSALPELYPNAFRRRYSEEMRRDFRELMLEGLQEGTTELVRVLAQAFSDLVLTALKERGTTAARRYAHYLSVEPSIAARAMVAVEAALESSLSVEEAERILQDLAPKGRLEVSVEHGRLLYALWDREAPP